MIFQANGIQRKASAATLIPDKIHFKTKTVMRDKDGHFVMVKGPMHPEVHWQSGGTVAFFFFSSHPSPMTF